MVKSNDGYILQLFDQAKNMYKYYLQDPENNYSALTSVSNIVDAIKLLLDDTTQFMIDDHITEEDSNYPNLAELVFKYLGEK